MNIKRIIKDTCILFIITIVSGCLLGFVYHSTKDKIASKQEETKLLAYKEVMSEADDFKADYSKLIVLFFTHYLSHTNTVFPKPEI